MCDEQTITTTAELAENLVEAKQELVKAAHEYINLAQLTVLTYAVVEPGSTIDRITSIRASQGVKGNLDDSFTNLLVALEEYQEEIIRLHRHLIEMVDADIDALVASL